MAVRFQCSCAIVFSPNIAFSIFGKKKKLNFCLKHLGGILESGNVVQYLESSGFFWGFQSRLVFFHFNNTKTSILANCRDFSRCFSVNLKVIYLSQYCTKFSWCDSERCPGAKCFCSQCSFVHLLRSSVHLDVAFLVGETFHQSSKSLFHCFS